MTRRTLSDAERIVSIREVIEAARGDWHEATALWSVGKDISWLLDRAEAAIDAQAAQVAIDNEASAQANYERSWDDAFRNRTEDDE